MTDGGESPHLKIFDLKAKAKLAAFANLGLDGHFTIVLIDYSLAYIEAQTNTLLILPTGILELAKHFEQLQLVHFLDSDTRINHID